MLAKEAISTRISTRQTAIGFNVIVGEKNPKKN